ncbi:MAG TPA: Asp-tRNA(Asn)/Glu-tRNA(Gln) amidotransferase GatCAB subunit B, partial [Lacibacter sp.]|nr:Asp-tRNA(Asn)/Glu-tRNA(Gln) amidotransferase GatCAB subunit B [Lacibacter sp.]
IRTKEEANDYRYLTDPDLPPFEVTETFIEGVRKSLPELPEEKRLRLQQQYALPEYDAAQLADDQELSAYFETAAAGTTAAKQVANWLLGPVRSWCNETCQEPDAFPIAPATFVRLLALVEDGTVSHTAAVQKLFPALLDNPAADPLELARQRNLLQERDETALQQLVTDVLAALPTKVQEYKKGKKGLIGLFVGEVMKKSGGKADPKLVQQLLTEQLAH